MTPCIPVNSLVNIYPALCYPSTACGCGFICLSLAFGAAAREDEGEEEDVDEGVLAALRVFCDFFPI